MIKYVPNLLTMLRIVLVPVFVLLIFKDTYSARIFSLIVFLIASISDLFDGLIARKYQVISDFGKVMDPLADKILVAAALIAMIYVMKYISIIAVIIILFREIAVTILREIYKIRKIYIAANVWGKIKTVMQMVGIIFSLTFYSFKELLHLNNYENEVSISINLYFWIVVVVTILSGLNYFIIPKKASAKINENLNKEKS